MSEKERKSRENMEFLSLKTRADS